MGGKETHTSTQNTTSFFIILLGLQINNVYKINFKCTQRGLQMSATHYFSNITDLYFSNTPENNRHVVRTRTAKQAQHNKRTHLSARIVAMVEVNPATSRIRDEGQY